MSSSRPRSSASKTVTRRRRAPLPAGGAMSFCRTVVGELRPSRLPHTFGIGSIDGLPHFSVLVAGLDDWLIVSCRPNTPQGATASPSLAQRAVDDRAGLRQDRPAQLSSCGGWSTQPTHHHPSGRACNPYRAESMFSLKRSLGATPPLPNHLPFSDPQGVDAMRRSQ